MSRFFYLITIVILVTLVSCKKSPETDFSLTNDEYCELGIPDYVEVWSLKDFENALIVLSNLKLTKPFSLPRKNSIKSADLFERMLLEDNFSFLHESQILLSAKALKLQEFSTVLNELILLYTSFAGSEQYYQEELVDIYLFGLFLNQKKLDIAQQIMKSESDSDIKLRQGYMSIQIGYLRMVQYILTNQNNFSLMIEDDLVRLSEEVSSSIQSNRDWIMESHVEAIKKALKGVIDSTPSEKIRSTYQQLFKTM